MSHQERSAVVLPGQGQTQGEPAGRDAGGLLRAARPETRAPVLLQDQRRRCTGGDSGGRPSFFWCYISGGQSLIMSEMLDAFLLLKWKLMTEV